jgi:hypothetical protein
MLPSRVSPSSVLAVILLATAAPASASAPIGHFRYTGNSTVVVDWKTGLTWQRTASSEKYSWVDAQSYCAAVSVPVVGGSGWRLPNIKELLSLVDYSQSTGPMIDTAAFPNAAPEQFWSALVPFNLYAGYVDFGTGRVSLDSQKVTHAVRCVR